MDILTIAGAVIASVTLSAITAYMIVNKELKIFYRMYLTILKDTTLEAVNLGLNRRQVSVYPDEQANKTA